MTEISSTTTEAFIYTTTQRKPVLEDSWHYTPKFDLSTFFIIIISAVLLVLIWSSFIFFYVLGHPRRNRINQRRTLANASSGEPQHTELTDLPPKYETALNMQKFPSVFAEGSVPASPIITDKHDPPPPTYDEIIIPEDYHSQNGITLNPANLDTTTTPRRSMQINYAGSICPYKALSTAK